MSEEILIEIVSDKNRQLRFPPTSEVLRGRWTAGNMSSRSMHESLAALTQNPVLYGIRLGLSRARRRARRYDPYSVGHEEAAAWSGIERVLRAYPSELRVMKPWEPVVRENITDDEIKDWGYWMRRAVDAGLAIEIKPGLLPLLKEIRHQWPGKRRMGLLAATFVAEGSRYTDNVPPPGQAELVGAGTGGSGTGSGTGSTQGGAGGGKGGKGKGSDE